MKDENLVKKVFSAVGNYFRHTDLILWGLCFIATAISVMMLISISYAGFGKQSLFVIQLIGSMMGVICAVIISIFDYHTLAKLWFLYTPVFAILVLLTLTPLGIERELTGDRAWLDFGFTTLQPSEFFKLVFVFTFAYHLSRVKEIGNINRLRYLIPVLLHAGAAIGLILLQKDTGTTLVFIFIFLCMIFAAGLSWKYITAALLSAPIVAYFLWEYVLKEHHKDRILVLFNLDGNTLGDGWQQSLGKIAMGSGMLKGKGLFSSGLSFVPEIYNDFIFAHIGQTLGFIGCVGTAFLLLMICFKILHVSMCAKDSLGRLLCIGVFAIIIFHSIINIGMVLCVVPVVGIPLPFISAGGSSALAMYAAIGIVQGVHARSSSKLMFESDGGRRGGGAG